MHDTALAQFLAFFRLDRHRHPLLPHEGGQEVRRLLGCSLFVVAARLWPPDDFAVQHPCQYLGGNMRFTGKRHDRRLTQALFLPDRSGLPRGRQVRSAAFEGGEQQGLVGVPHHDLRTGDAFWHGIRVGYRYHWQFRWWHSLFPAGLYTRGTLPCCCDRWSVIAIALQSAALCRDRVARFGSADADHAHLRIVLEGAHMLRLCTIRKLPDAYAVIPATPVVDHGAIPGRTSRDNGNHHSAWHEQHASVGDDAVFGAFAVLEKVRRVREDETHASFGDAHTLKGATDKFGLGQARVGNSCPFGADLHTVETGIWDILAGNKQVAFPCGRVKHVRGLACLERQEGTYDACSECWRRTHKGRVGQIG